MADSRSRGRAPRQLAAFAGLTLALAGLYLVAGLGSWGELHREPTPPPTAPPGELECRARARAHADLAGWIHGAGQIRLGGRPFGRRQVKFVARRVVPSDSSGLLLGETAFSDEDGCFEISLQRANSFETQVLGFSEMGIHRVDPAERLQFFEIDLAGGWIEGHVLDPDGAPLPYWPIFATRLDVEQRFDSAFSLTEGVSPTDTEGSAVESFTPGDDEDFEQSAELRYLQSIARPFRPTTDADGRYALALPPGRYALFAHREPDWAFVGRARILQLPHRVEVELGDGDRIEGLDLDQGTSASILGVVLDATRDPVPEATITTWLDGTRGPETRTDDRGEFALYDLRPGWVTIEASDGSRFGTTVRSTQPGEAIAVTVTAGAGSGLRVFFRDPEGTLLDPWPVLVSDAASGPAPPLEMFMPSVARPEVFGPLAPGVYRIELDPRFAIGTSPDQTVIVSGPGISEVSITGELRH